jgi:hypothetical protein
MKKSELKALIKECIKEVYNDLPNTHRVGVIDTRVGKVSYQEGTDEHNRLYYDVHDSKGLIGRKFVVGGRYPALHNLESAIKQYAEEERGLKESLLKEHSLDSGKTYNLELNVDGQILDDASIYVNEFDFDVTPGQRQTMDQEGFPEEIEITNIDMWIAWEDMEGYDDPKDIEAVNKLKAAFGTEETNNNQKDKLYNLLTPKAKERLINDLTKEVEDYNPY